MYNKIYDFCKVRNKGNCFQNGETPQDRVLFILDLLKSEGIEYELDIFKPNRPTSTNCSFFNIILKGTSDKMVVAHHDIVNPTTDNANDNSCSVINAIMLKKLKPELNVVLTDGEEFGGIGSQRLSEQILDGKFGNIPWVLNLELTGKGGEYFFIGDYPGPLFDHIKTLFDCPVVRTPFNDSVIFQKNGIDSVVINPIPPIREATEDDLKDKYNVIYKGMVLDFKMLYNCHSPKDTIDTISPDDMKEFVEKVLIKILE